MVLFRADVLRFMVSSQVSEEERGESEEDRPQRRCDAVHRGWPPVVSQHGRQDGRSLLSGTCTGTTAPGRLFRIVLRRNGTLHTQDTCGGGSVAERVSAPLQNPANPEFCLRPCPLQSGRASYWQAVVFPYGVMHVKDPKLVVGLHRLIFSSAAEIPDAHWGWPTSHCLNKCRTTHPRKNVMQIVLYGWLLAVSRKAVL